MAEVLFRARLVREESGTPWGFRLQGGVEYDKPLTLLKVVPESLAAKGGLHPGDIVVKLAGKSADDMTHKDAQEAIISAANTLEIIVERAEVTITSSPNSPPEKAPNGIVSSALSGQPSVNSGLPSENSVQPSANSGKVSTDSGQSSLNSGPGTSNQEASSLSPSSVEKKDSQKNEVLRKGLPEVLHNELPKHEEVTVNSLTDVAGAMSPTNNNIKGMVNLESCSDPALLGKDHNSISPLQSTSTTTRNTNTENAKEVHIKSNVGPDNNVSLDRAIEGSSNSKHKPLGLTKDIKAGSCSEGDSQVAVSAVLCDNTPTPGGTQNDLGLEDASQNADTKQLKPAGSTQEICSTSTTSSAKMSPTLKHKSEQSPNDNSVTKGKESGTLSNSLPESEVTTVSTSDAVDSKLDTKENLSVPNTTLSAEQLKGSAESSLEVSAECNSGDGSEQFNSTCKPEVSPNEGVESTAGNCDTNDTASSELVAESAALSTSTIFDTSAESGSNSSIGPGDKVLVTSEDNSSVGQETSELKNSSSVAPSDCQSNQDNKDNTAASPDSPSDAPQNTIQNPTVIKDFQSGLAVNSQPSSPRAHPTVTQQPEPPSSTGESKSDRPSADAPTLSNIPSSVPSSVKHDVQESPATIAMVLTEVPKPHIQAYVVSEIPKKEKEQTKSPTDKSENSKSNKRSTTPISAAKAEKKPGTVTPITITNLKGVPLAQTVLKTPEPISRQTKAPTEEIIIAPKPSVQIMTGHDQKDSAKVPSGEQHLVEKPDGKPVSHEMKDFSKTAPWRVPKQTVQQAPPPSHGGEQHVIHPWRKSRTENIMSHSLDDRQLSAATGRLTPTPDGTDLKRPDAVQRTASEFDIASTKPQSTLTYVGKRIESPPVGSPIGPGAPFFKVGSSTSGPAAGRDVPPSGRANTVPICHTSTMPTNSHPNTIPKPSPTKGSQAPPQADVGTFQAAAPDLVDMQMPPVKDIVETLNSQLESRAERNPLIVEPNQSQELGLNYFRRSQEDLSGPMEREIIINTPPNPHYAGPIMEDMPQHLFVPGAGGYLQPYYDMVDTTMSPASHRRRFSLPGGSVAHRQNQRRVRFAEPLESSVIEIEPRKQRILERLGRRRLLDDEGSLSDIEDYSSASSLDAKLDRIERKNALSNASFQRARQAKQLADSRSGDIAQVRPAESFRERVNNFEALGEPKRDDIVLSSLKPSKEFPLGPSRSGARGISLSIGQSKPGSISLSLTPRGAGHPQPQVALSVPSTEGHFTYTISPRTGSSDPFILRYTTPASAVGEPVLTTGHVKAPSLDSAKTIHIQYPPQEGVPTLQAQLLNTSSAGPLSPPQHIIRQLAGRPGLRSPTNYSNTLQIDTSSRLQHRSPSPPHLSVSPNLQSERTRLSPQRLAPPSSRLHEAPGMDQSRRPSSPNQGPVLGQQPAFKVRQPSPANPMAYQRSASPQGIPQYRPGSPVVTVQSSSPRNVSPVSFQHPQPVRLQSTVGYPRSVSPQYSLPAPLSQNAPRQPQPVGLTSVQPRALRKLPPQQYLQPPGYPLQQPQAAPQPRYSARLQGQPPPSYPGTVTAGAGAPAPAGNRLPLGPLSREKTRQLIQELLLRGPEALGLPPGFQLPTATPPTAQAAQSDSEEPQGMFAFLDKDFMQRFLHADPERQEGLYESETYKLVHEMDEEDDDMSSSC